MLCSGALFLSLLKMSSRFVRSSKYRHVFGTPFKREKCYDNIRITKSPHDSNMCSVNGKFVAVVLESQGGGAFLVAPLSKVCGEGGSRVMCAGTLRSVHVKGSLRC